MASSGVSGPGVRTLTTAGLVAVVGAIVLGILGMHGLSQHGIAPAATGHSSPVATSGTAMHAGHAGHDVGGRPHAAGGLVFDPAMASSPSLGAGTEVVSSGGLGGSAGHVATMCAAMLLAAVSGVLLTLLLRRIARRAAFRLKALAPALMTFASSRLGTGPPAVWEFSVVRC